VNASLAVSLFDRVQTKSTEVFGKPFYLSLKKSTMPKNGLKTKSAPTQVINMTIHPELFTKPMHVK
jgi:hypothetical protein